MVGGDDYQIDDVQFNWRYGEVQVVTEHYGQGIFPHQTGSPAHNVGGLSFFRDTGQFQSPTREHETGHMLNNFSFGFWQGVINAIEEFGPRGHNDQLFEQLAESNVGEERGRPRIDWWGEPDRSVTAGGSGGIPGRTKAP